MSKAQNELITQAIYRACITEIKAFKPGNVSVHSEGHGMQAADFIRSAELIAPVMGMPELNVGERILQSVQLTMSQVGCNTNLGIILLAAPLAQAAHQLKEGAYLSQEIGLVLEGLSIEDADQAFEAIALAKPGGLGEVADQDVREPATVTLLAAMQAAQKRDRIAWQYANQFRDIFDQGVNNLRMQLLRWKDIDDRLEWASVACYLNFMACHPDSHIQRKYGLERAEQVQQEAKFLAERFQDISDPTVANDELQRYDTGLKREGINPGTSADLTVASLFALALDALL